MAPRRKSAPIPPNAVLVRGHCKPFSDRVEERCKQMEGRTVSECFASGIEAHLIKYDLSKNYVRLVKNQESPREVKVEVKEELDGIDDHQPSAAAFTTPLRTCNALKVEVIKEAPTPSTRTPATESDVSTVGKRKLHKNTSDPIDEAKGPVLARKKLIMDEIEDTPGPEEAEPKEEPTKGWKEKIPTPMAIQSEPKIEKETDETNDCPTQMVVERSQKSIPARGSEITGQSQVAMPSEETTEQQVKRTSEQRTIPATSVQKGEPQPDPILLRLLTYLNKTIKESSSEDDQRTFHNIKLSDDAIPPPAEDVVDQLIGLLCHPKVAVGRDAFHALRQAMIGVEAGIAEKAQTAITDLLDTSSTVMKTLALEALPDLKPHSKLLTRCIKMLDENEMVACNAKDVLCKYGHYLWDAHIDQIVSRTESPNAFTRRAAIAFLGSSGKTLQKRPDSVVKHVLANILRISPGDGAPDALAQLRSHGLSLSNFNVQDTKRGGRQKSVRKYR